MRTKKGIVTSAKMTGTVTVTTHRSVLHAKYKKHFTVSKKFLVDSKGFDLAVGDEVLITECRPISKRKCFRVTQILKSAPRVSEIADEADIVSVTKKSSLASSESSTSSASSK